MAIHKASHSINRFLDIEGARDFLVEACKHYAQAPEWLITYLDNLYIRLGEEQRLITMDEMITISTLYEEGQWLSLDYALSTIYKLIDRIGQDTTGYISRRKRLK